MDDLLALIEEEPLEEETSEETTIAMQEKPPRKKIKQQRHAEKTKPPISDKEQLALTVDDRVGIRMLHRKMSGADLLSLISEVPAYHSPASLAAMSFQQRNKLLVSPSSSSSSSEAPTGRTHVVTVGIVFNNSGTRISSNSGNGFCVLSIGNLSTGPTVTVLAFGGAYSQVCRKCPPGKVVALVGPKLIPPRSNTETRSTRNDTAITFTVSSPEELRLVADARDYGVCKATVRGGQKNERQQWVTTEKNCHHFVDTRLSEYCETHRRSNSRNSKTHVAMNGMQQLRAQGNLFRPGATLPSNNLATGKRLMVPPTASTGRAGQKNQNSLLSRYGNSSGAQMMLRDKKKLNPQRVPRDPVPTKALSNRSTSFAHPAADTLVSLQTSSRTSFTSAMSNPTGRGPPSMRKIVTPLLAGARRQHKPNQSSRSRAPAKGDWLQEATNKKSQSSMASRTNAVKNKTTKRINTESCGFNGSVPVPQPSRMFDKRHQQNSSGNITATISSRPAVREDNVADHVVAQQRLLAERMREQHQHRKTDPSRRSGTCAITQPHKSFPATVSHSLYDTLGDMNTEGVREAKSKFTQEVNAEEYVRSRRIVTELEQKEEKELKKKKKSEADASTIKKEWACQTCQRCYDSKPTSCLRNRHSITVKRKIVATKTVAEKRLALAGKDAADGGMVLGKGLDWSQNGWSRFS